MRLDDWTIENWTAEAIRLLLAESATHVGEIVPSDFLLPGSTGPSDVGVELSVAHEMFRTMVEIVAPHSHQLRARLDLSIDHHNGLVTDSPMPDDLTGTAHYQYPPRLALTSWRIFNHPNTFEEYRKPLPQTIHQPSVGCVRAYYVTDRTEEGTEHDWDYERLIRFIHFSETGPGYGP